MRTGLQRLSIFILLLCSCFYSPLARSSYDCSQKLVCDSGFVLNGGQYKQLNDFHQALLERFDMDYRVVILSDAGDIALKAVALFKEMKVGSRSKTKKGLLLLIDPALDKVRLEIASGLDAVYTDAFVAYLEQRQMVPFFKVGRVADGILATTELIVTRAQKAAKGEEFIAPSQVPEVLAIGAGAQTNASINKGQDVPLSNDSSDIPSAGLTPQQVVDAYHQALAEKNASSTLSIYSQGTQAMRKQWVVTAAQMASELATYQHCTVDQVIELKERGLAVVRYKVDQRQCAPYFLVKENGEWKLDFENMMHTVRFNISNEWHLDMNIASPYNEAFDDWSFNKNGYPFPMQKMRWGLLVETNYRTGATFIKRIYPGMPVEQMGFKEKDIILKWDNIEHPDYQQVILDMDKLKPGESFKVDLQRDGSQMTLDLVAPPNI